ncbi:MAG: HAD family phosphatase [Candidatus Bathyarchaeia archaeon]
MFKAVIFDWDGTLADTRWVLVKAFNEAFKLVGCAVSEEFIVRLIGVGERRLFEEALKSANIPFREDTLKRLSRRKFQVQSGLAGKVQLIDGAVELLHGLHGRVKIGLATMARGMLVRRILAEKGIEGLFDAVVSMEEVSRPKPDPEVFLKCALKLRVKPEECVVVEDSVFGVEAAKRAGMRCIAIASGAYSMEELKERNPDLILPSIKERNAILNFILNHA